MTSRSLTACLILVMFAPGVAAGDAAKSRPRQPSPAAYERASADCAARARDASLQAGYSWGSFDSFARATDMEKVERATYVRCMTQRGLKVDW